MIRVRFFAAAAERTGTKEQLRTETTLADVRKALAQEYPALAEILPKCAILADGTRVDDHTKLGTEITIDVLPPFTGG